MRISKFGEWQPIETLVDHDPVLFSCVSRKWGNSYVEKGFKSGNEFFDGATFKMLDKVTHWMPLPEPMK